MPNSIIASTITGVPESALHGFAQVDGDFIFGDSGRKIYGTVLPGHDGAYVSVVRRSADSALVGTDAAGYGRLYLYQRGFRWALGTSLMELADYVRSLDWPLGVDRLQLTQFLFRSNMLVNQLISLDTVFPEVRLVATSEEVEILHGRLSSYMVRQRETLTCNSDYRATMQDAIDEMVGRMRTLLQAEMPVASAISGGRDSRTILAALRVADEASGDIGLQVRFRSNERRFDDWAVAKLLSSRYGLHLNRASDAPELPVDPGHSFDLWRTHDLGVYSSIYQFLSYTPEVALSGVGGETHRAAYSGRSLVDRLRRVQTEFVADEAVDALAVRIEHSLDFLGGHRDRHLEHYRQFRNRFHGGRAPLRTAIIAPLNTKKFRAASSLMSATYLSQAQFLADIMLNFAPDLAIEPYDSPGKSWSEKHYEDLTRLTPDPERFVGRVYGNLEPPPVTVYRSQKPLEPFFEAFHEAAPAAVESGLLPRRFVKEAEKKLQETQGRRFRHAEEGRDVSTVILAGQVAELAPLDLGE